MRTALHAEPRREANAAWGILAPRLSSQDARRPYLLTLEGEFSYAQVGEEVARASGFFRQRGLCPGDRVLFAMADRRELVVGFWAALWAGLVAVPVAPMLAPPELRQVLLDCRPRLALTDPRTAKALTAAAEGVTVEVVVCSTPPPWATARPLWEAVPVSPQELALLLYTSGTTGRMKGVMHSHANLLAAAGGLGPQVLQLSPEDRLLSTARMFFAYGLGNSVYIPAAAGAGAVVHPGPVLPGVVAELFQRFRPTVLFAVPSVLAALSAMPFSPGALRAVVSAGEKLAPSLARRARRQLGAPVLDGLGMTETLHHVTSNHLNQVVPGSAGAPLAGFSLEVRDPTGAAVTEGELGELWVRGPTVMLGYWEKPGASARALVGGWLRTGDMVRFSGGLVYHQGRRDEMLKLGGIAVFPSEVEAVLAKHPAVAEAAVVPVPLAGGAATLKAVVVLREGAQLEEGELYRFCRKHLAAYKVPRQYQFVPRLPRTLTGKVRRLALVASDPS